jgi:hypothetical protein
MKKHPGPLAFSALVGLWVLVSPWVFPTAVTDGALNFHVAGAIGAALALIAWMRLDEFAEFGTVALGVWLVISPWVLGLSDLVTRQAILYGVVIGCLGWFGRPSLKPAGSGPPPGDISAPTSTSS